MTDDGFVPLELENMMNLDKGTLDTLIGIGIFVCVLILTIHFV